MQTVSYLLSDSDRISSFFHLLYRATCEYIHSAVCVAAMSWCASTVFHVFSTFSLFIRYDYVHGTSVLRDTSYKNFPYMNCRKERRGKKSQISVAAKITKNTTPHKSHFNSYLHMNAFVISFSLFPTQIISTSICCSFCIVAQQPQRIFIHSVSRIVFDEFFFFSYINIQFGYCMWGIYLIVCARQSYHTCKTEFRFQL